MSYQWKHELNAKPSEYASNWEKSQWNNIHRDVFDKPMELKPMYVPPPILKTPDHMLYKSPNPISDFFCAASNSSPWPHTYRG